MLRLAKWALVLAALAAVVAFVPVGGRTVLARWRAARTPGEFLARSWAESTRAAARLRDGDAASRPPATARTPPGPAPRAFPHPPGTRPPPVERHTDADRSELDAIVAEHVR